MVSEPLLSGYIDNTGEHSMTRQDNIATLEAEFLNDALLEFVEAMRDDVDATDDEIKQSILKELQHILKTR
jgi:hypothetical protein